MTPEQVLIYHQRKDIAGCICGWGSHTGHLGESHSLHVIDELEKAGYVIVFDDRGPVSP